MDNIYRFVSKLKSDNIVGQSVRQQDDYRILRILEVTQFALFVHSFIHTRADLLWRTRRSICFDVDVAGAGPCVLRVNKWRKVFLDDPLCLGGTMGSREYK